MSKKKLLNFERPLTELYDKIEELKQLSSKDEIHLEEEITRIETRAEVLKKEIYANLTPNQIIQIARHQSRPDSTSLIQLISKKYVPLHGYLLFKLGPST